MEGFKRPEAIVLPDTALVPPANKISPAPNQFTHEIVSAQPFYFGDGGEGQTTNGEFQVGTRVLLFFHDGGPMCRVVDRAGLFVSTAFAGLRPLGTASTPPG